MTPTKITYISLKLNKLENIPSSRVEILLLLISLEERGDTAGLMGAPVTHTRTGSCHRPTPQTPAAPWGTTHSSVSAERFARSPTSNARSRLWETSLGSKVVSDQGQSPAGHRADRGPPHRLLWGWARMEAPSEWNRTGQVAPRTPSTCCAIPFLPRVPPLAQQCHPTQGPKHTRAAQGSPGPGPRCHWPGEGLRMPPRHYGGQKAGKWGGGHGGQPPVMATGTGHREEQGEHNPRKHTGPATRSHTAPPGSTRVGDHIHRLKHDAWLLRWSGPSRDPVTPREPTQGHRDQESEPVLHKPQDVQNQT